MKHPYLSDVACIYRLVDEFNKYGSLVVAFDFDNTIFDYHSKNHDYSDVVNLLRECKDMGFYLICFTAEEDMAKVKAWLKTLDVPYDSVNENPPFFKGKSGKVYFNTLLDDRAGLASAFYQLKETISIIKNKI